MTRRPARRAALATGAAALTLIGSGAVAAAAPEPSAPTTSFASSLEPGDPAPISGNAADRATGVVPDASTLPGSVMHSVTSVTASDTAAGHPPQQAVDGNPGTVWTAPTPAATLTVQLASAAHVATYAITSAPNSPALDPRSWQLQGSADGQGWTTLDTRADQTFSQRGQTRLFSVAHPNGYPYYRLDITADHGDPNTQLAELVLAAAATDAPGMTAQVGAGPSSGPTIKPGVGFTGLHALHYGGWQLAGTGSATDTIYQTDVAVHPDTTLSYKIFPEATGNDLAYPSTYVALDLQFSDGTRLSQLGAVDQNGVPLTARGQGAGEILFPRQWNSVSADIGTVAVGKTITGVLVSYDDPNGPAHFGGWIDDLSLSRSPGTGTHCAHPSQCVVTTRGTNSSGDYSRGNTFPAVAVPHGFNFWTPVTDAGSTSTLYAYQQQNTANEPTIQAFSASHEPSIWVQDHQTFQVMPSPQATPATADRATRALAFSHQNETARADYYGVTFDDGIRTEIAPTDHAAELRFTFPHGGDSLIFDDIKNDGGLTVDPAAGTISGYSDVVGFWGAPRMFVYATFDHPMKATASLPGGGGANVTRYANFDLGGGDTLTMRIATSFISVDQAKHNLDLEIGTSDFDTVQLAAQRTWDQQLGVIQLHGATPDQQVSQYSDLYRLNLYPNELFENVGPADDPHYQYASPYAPSAGPNTPTHTGATVKDGQPYANEGFWDTSRASWPLDALLYPDLTGKMIDGFVQQFRDGGWIGQWTAPGYIGFGGTNSDLAIADAYLRGVTNFDVAGAYDAAIKDATAPGGGLVGRPDVNDSTFLGYIPASSGSSASTSLENYAVDHGIARMSLQLYRTSAASDPRHQEYLDNYHYFTGRAQGYVKLFDSRVGFFQPRNADGSFVHSPDQFDPLSWNGNDYLEGNAWSYAFAAAEDGQGLANLYGGRAGLAQKLDQFFGTPETAQFGGSFFGPYHEMFESRDDRLGQWAYNDQPTMHVAYMYDYAGQPAKTEHYVRSALSRTFTGSDIGQGFPGDEDNGSMAAFYVASALGLYPLQSGSPTWAIGSPLYSQAVIHPIGGKTLVINAPGNSPQNVYVQGLTVNGHPSDRTYVDHADLAAGADLTFTMGPQPSAWGTAPDDAPPSPTQGSAVPNPPADLTAPGGAVTASADVASANLVDNTSSTQVVFPAGPASVGYHFDQTRQVTQYTLTAGAQAGDPSGWTLQGSADGVHWTTVDQRTGEQFSLRQQTRAFTVASPGSFSYYRIELAAGSTPIRLSEIELLGTP